MQVLHSKIQVFLRTLIAWVTSHSNLSATRAFIWSLKIKLIKEHLMGKDTKIPFFRCCLGIQNCIKNMGTKVTYDIGYQKRNLHKMKGFWMRKGKPLYIPLTYLALYSNSNSFSINEHILPTISECMKLAIFEPNLCVIYMQYVYAFKKAFYIDIVFLWSTLDIWNKT